MIMPGLGTAPALRDLLFFRQGPIEALHAVEALIDRRAHAYVCFCEANLLSRAAGDPRLRTILNEADLLCPDGIAAVRLARAWGQPAMERVPGPSFLLAACGHGVPRQWRHYFYGGAPGVADLLASRLGGQFPGLRVTGTYSPPFRPLSAAEDVDVVARIEATRPDLLWVGLGGPRQELWMADHRGRLDVPVMLGVGAAFDFHSGERPWAPACVRRAGLEWAWRMFTGGPKMFRRNLRCVAATGRLLAWASLLRVLGRPKRCGADTPRAGSRSS